MSLTLTQSRASWRTLSLVLAVGGLAIASCSDRRAVVATNATTPTVVSTTTTTSTSTTETTKATTTTQLAPATTTSIATDGRPIGASVTGNRVILIGDSVLASTASRFHGEMCDVLVPLGWRAEVDAEKSKYIDFASTVLDRRLNQGWDVAVILLGNNYTGDEVFFASQLATVVQRLAPRPTLLLTVSEPGFTGGSVEVNEVIAATARLYGNVRVVDWAAVTAGDPTMLKDRVHPRASGRDALTALIASELGSAPQMPGKCLETEFNDD